MIPVYSLLLVCVLPLQVHTRPRVHWASGIPHALQGGERFFNGSGAWRGEIVRVCLQTMRLFENEFGVGTERGAAITPQTASVMPGLDPRLSGSILVDEAHDMDSSGFRALAAFETPKGI